MSRGAQLQISRTRDITDPNIYISALLGELREFAFDEERAPGFNGRWRQEVFSAQESSPLDLEIGTGNGFHFARQALRAPDRNLLGIELKYKPLIQAIRRVLRDNGRNARMLRYNAALVHELFAEGELNNVYIHFPDPWPRLRQQKHRLIQDEFLLKLHSRQRPGSFVEFKTDSRDYFDWAVERFKRGPHQLQRLSYDLHRSEWADSNFVTHFERIFLRQGLPIHYALLVR